MPSFLLPAGSRQQKDQKKKYTTTEQNTLRFCSPITKEKPIFATIKFKIMNNTPYNFDEVIDRRNTHALKTDALKERWGRDDLMPLWVADMDFRTPPFILEAIRKRCEHEILGYTCKHEGYYRAIIAWLKSRFGWKVTPEMINFTPGIVPGLAFAIQCFTREGDRVIVQPPVYHPFFLTTQNNNREVVWNPLILEDGQFRMDFGHLEKIITGCKLFILCNPHNPGGRSWTKEELARLAGICYDHGVPVVSDEIHADLTLPPHRHVPFATVSDKAANNSVTFMSPSKAFNMAGLSSSYCIVPDPALRKKFFAYLEASELTNGHLFSFISVEAAYSNGTEWLEQMLAYVQGNIDFTDNYLRDNIPGVRAMLPEASFLIFLDCRELNLTQEQLVGLFVDKARLALNDGEMFGCQGKGFMRLNVACPRSVLEKALTQLKGACDTIGK